jgi:hypothetical protein
VNLIHVSLGGFDGVFPPLMGGFFSSDANFLKKIFGLPVRSSGVFERKCKKLQKNLIQGIARNQNNFHTFASEVHESRTHPTSSLTS